MSPTVHRYAVASFLFRQALPGAVGDVPWGPAFLREVFVDHEYSVRNFWRRATLGLVDLEFDFLDVAAWTFDEYGQAGAQGRGGRNRTVEAARAFCKDNDIALDGYDHLVVVVPPGPTDAGATPGDVAFDQATATLPFLQHEIGHTLRFQRAFGGNTDCGDPYCVMGYTGMQSHAIAAPPRFAARPRNGTAFWRSERRPSAASLWRHLAAVKLSRERVSYVEGAPPASVRIAGLCATGTGDPRSPATDGDPRTIVAVVPRRGHPNQHLTVEYRPAVGDDAGVTPAVVVHSIGANFVGVGRDEVDPPWFEASLPPVVGAFADVLGYRFTVVAVSAAAPEWVEVRIQLSSSSEA